MRLFALISIVLFLFAGSALLVEVRPQLKYHMRGDAYRWIGQKIYDNTAIDTAFIGSSQIWTAVDTQLINERLSSQRSYNLGANWHGRHANYVIIRDLLEAKHVDRVVLEIGHREHPRVHGYSRFLGGLRDGSHLDFFSKVKARDALVLANPFKRAVGQATTYYSYLGVKGYYLLAKSWVTGGFLTESFESRDTLFGYHNVRVSAERQREVFAELSNTPERYATDEAYANVDTKYLSEIAAVCAKKRAELVFLFVPKRNEPLPGPTYLRALGRFGRPVVVPTDGLYQYKNWRDKLHFNRRGTELFTARLLKSPLYSAVRASDSASRIGKDRTDHRAPSVRPYHVPTDSGVSINAGQQVSLLGRQVS